MRPIIPETSGAVVRDRPVRPVGAMRLEEKTMFRRGKAVRNLDADEVARGMRQNRILLVDVREPNETALEGFPGAVLLPLSSFDPTRIPDPEGREVVFACRSGRRSVTASQAAQT